MKRLLAAALSVAALSVMTACSISEEPGKVVEEGDSSGRVIEESTDEPSDDAASEDTPTEEASSTASIGDTVQVGDWQVEVTELSLNADKVIAKANQFNDKPKGSYVLVTFEATYTGAERTADIDSDLSWSLTTTDNQVNDAFSAVTPADDEEWATEARSGGTVRGQQVWDLDPKLVKGGLLTVETYDADFDTVFADFAI